MNTLLWGKEIQSGISHLLDNPLLHMSASTQLTIWLGTEEHASSPRHFPGIFSFQVPFTRVENINQLQSWHTNSFLSFLLKRHCRSLSAHLDKRNESVLGILMTSNNETLRHATLGLR